MFRRVHSRNYSHISVSFKRKNRSVSWEPQKYYLPSRQAKQENDVHLKTDRPNRRSIKLSGSRDEFPLKNRILLTKASVNSLEDYKSENPQHCMNLKNKPQRPAKQKNRILENYLK